MSRAPEAFLLLVVNGGWMVDSEHTTQAEALEAGYRVNGRREVVFGPRGNIGKRFDTPNDARMADRVRQ